MIGTIPPVVVVLKTLTLLLGGLITAVAAKAAHRTGATGLALLAAGFATVTLGSLAAGLADQVFAIAHADALVLENALTTVGFAIIAYSLAVTRGLR